MLVGVVAIDLDELLEDGGLASCTLDGEASAVVEVAKDVAVVLVVAVLRAKDGGADRAGKVLDVELLAKRRDVAAPERTAALCADEIQTAEVVGLAKRKETTCSGRVDHVIGGREELGSHDLLAVVAAEAVQVIDTAESSNKLTGHDFAARLARLVAASRGAGWR